ncbi:hypothetical protein [Amycolatopsis regifaucium]|uniref:Uncharacterized protein n=1 Tax=Amycolatopsis regifaucium TaxID=546365 RepID=A0A154M8U3_9PSEU|nr:hypothetical protein [Amycolatopsis regifaucium]KZB80737.1 hypothetical protein AVL48_12305 [Amycolatopsis regifaucium]OKA07727.1 hypothetical protein ATP06_0218140 [Amycolatopsis regifaucium]SFH04231.1 hypothetical protein SAMN04489731_102181 [Amycolatopsis regifaucium]
MRKSLLALAALPVAGALATIGAGVASAAPATGTGSESAVQLMANCDPIWRLADRAGGKCYDIAFRVGVRCKSTRGDWEVFFSPWTQKNFSATAFCPAGWESVSADYDLPD